MGQEHTDIIMEGHFNVRVPGDGTRLSKSSLMYVQSLDPAGSGSINKMAEVDNEIHESTPVYDK